MHDVYILVANNHFKQMKYADRTINNIHYSPALFTVNSQSFCQYFPKMSRALEENISSSQFYFSREVVETIQNHLVTPEQSKYFKIKK